MAKKTGDDNAGIFVPAGLFIGLGFGALYNQWVAGVMFGLGVGFVGMAIAKVWGRK